ncbi:preprotein translocase subunit YajC [Novosphingobium flavum]|uniref:Preprotein translocase subunit YajC n=1 Tax=Novosphingobium flavum TaxID=1778672 RepID=A0A7X1FSV2_9SPHN|nr:preprotein translocase subunit YajC [Novosphingobium flavum]MBC2666346.1 preprotein translocase subunit YajC [Novosphingobium flavum]
MRIRLLLLSGAALAVAALPASAQTIGYGSSSEAATGSDSPAEDSSAQGDEAYGLPQGKKMPGTGRNGHREKLKLQPYIEAAQVMTADLSPDHDVLTWTTLAAGVDGQIKNRSSEAAFSVRYQRTIGYGRAADSGTLSGLVRGGTVIVPNTLSLEGGALATRTTIGASGQSLPGGFKPGGSSRMWAAYAGPNLTTHAGPAAVNGYYRVGYTELGNSTSITANGAAASADLFDHSWVQSAGLHAGVGAGEVLPVGLGAGAAWYREDISNLAQRVDDFTARADITVPVDTNLALVGGVGWEKVEISSRDVLRDSSGAPVIGADLRYVTDNSAPRQIAYESTGVIWDAGVTWRPSRRTALEAHVGWRYGGTTAYGSFGWMPNRRTIVNVSVYDSMSGIGGTINRALVSLPSDFLAQRDPVTGDINGCVVTLQPGACVTGAFGSARSATFRGRGVMASYSTQIGGFGTGLAGGYDNRKFIAAPGTILASANGVIDETTWLSAWFNGRLGPRTTFGSYVFANWYHSGQVPNGDGTAFGVTGSLSHTFDQHLSANAALSLYGLEREAAENTWNASALVGMRYAF